MNEYLSEASQAMHQIPHVYPPATAEGLLALERRARQVLDPSYRAFLLLTDGMDGFRLGMPLFGCHDWGGQG
ncbi:hypothetical protein [Streptomyces sp. NPDC000618]|uniref:hypothetical protein n=1 Tax=Streptomyces sp. NPDC000618 TaxID=3154265 RepID=UPI00332974CA